MGVSLISALCCPSQSTLAQQTGSRGQAHPSVNHEMRIKSQVELTLEAVIEDAYLSCFKDYQIQGKQVTLRIPFGQNDERYGVGEFSQQICGGGDIFLFRGHGGIFRHSTVIQSIDLDKGVIRYVQCTDWAPQEERGVHESFICFDANNPEVSLKDSSVRWTQRIYPTFVGEPPLRYWKDDGDRYRTEWPTGQSLIVRLNLIKRLIEDIMPTFYSNEKEDIEQLLD